MGNAYFKLFYNTTADSFISIKDKNELTKDQQVKLIDIMENSIRESWSYDDRTTEINDCSIYGYSTEKDGNNIILSMFSEISFYATVAGYYDPGRTYGPMEDCYPPDLDFEEVEIIFNEKKCKDLILNDMSKEECLKDLVVYEIDPDCYSFDECSSYEFDEDYDDRW